MLAVKWECSARAKLNHREQSANLKQKKAPGTYQGLLINLKLMTGTI